MRYTEMIRLLVRGWLIVLLCALVLAAAAFTFSKLQTPRYTARSGQYFSIAAGSAGMGLSQSATYIESQMPSYVQLATSQLVLGNVISELGLNTTPRDLGRAVSVSAPRDTVVMNIDAEDPDPAQAAAIANAVGGQTSKAVALVGPKGAGGRPLVTARAIRVAQPPTETSSPNTRLNTALGFLAGLLLSSGIIIARAQSDTRVRSPQALADVAALQLLGTIERSNKLHDDGLVVSHESGNRSAEDFRRVRASIESLAADRPAAIVITSSIRNEGRTVVAANLAAALAEVGRKAVVLEADLRNPRLAWLLTSDNDSGLLAALEDLSALDRAIQRAPGLEFDVVPAGGRHSNPVEVLSSKSMHTLIDTLRQRYDFVLIDTPALLDASDAAILHADIDGAIVVVDAERIRRHQLENALVSAQLSGLKTLGFVLNKA